MPNPFNPLDWVRTAQDWFRRTEKSSGFRPYLIFLIIHCGFAIVSLTAFQQIELIRTFIINSLYISFGGFVILFAFKSIQEPSFCRSEKHIETVKRLELMEQKGDRSASPIDARGVEVIGNPEKKLIAIENGVRHD
jgi:hypothetical protein